MPRPHEQAAIDRASGPHKQRLSDAATLLDRVRAEYPASDDPLRLPEHVRSDILAALRAFRGGRSFGVPQLVLMLLLAVGLAASWLKPLRAFRCSAQGQGRAQCVVAERLLGVFPLREQVLEGIAGTQSGAHTTTSESRDDQGRTRTLTTRVDELAFKDAAGRVLWSSEESHLIGAAQQQLATEVAALAAGERSDVIVRVQAVWVVLLLGTLFCLIGVSSLGTELGLLLRDRGLIPQSVHVAVFHWGAFVVPLLLFGLAWALAGLGADPPAALVSVLRLG